jgi:hypothetical protein
MADNSDDNNTSRNNALAMLLDDTGFCNYLDISLPQRAPAGISTQKRSVVAELN